MKMPRLFLAAIAAVTVAAIVSCSDANHAAPTAPGPTPEASLVGRLLQSTGLVACRPQPYDSVTQTVGPAGGEIRVGNDAFRVPPGALDRPVAITAVVPTASVNEIEFQPQGLQFEQPATLSMSYANCGLVFALLPHHIAYVNDGLRILELLPALDDVLDQTATAQIRHFSGYAIAY